MDCAKGLVFVVTASILLGAAMANEVRRFGNGFKFTNKGWGMHSGPQKIIVGGSEGWHFGFNYSRRASENGPYFLYDTLVFKYDAPNSTTRPHSVYLFPNRSSYLKCDLKKAERVANWTQGSIGGGFEFVLKKLWKPYYLTCGEHDGLHCKDGGMKFSVMPTFRRWYK